MVDTSAEARARRDGGAGHEPPGERAGPHHEELSAWIGELREELDRSVLAFRRTVVLQKAKIRVALVDGLFVAALGAVGGLVGAVLVALGTALVVIGVRGGLRTATDGAWWVDVVLGLVLLGAIAGGVLWMRKRATRKVVSSTREKLAGMAGSNGAARATTDEEAV